MKNTLGNYTVNYENFKKDIETIKNIEGDTTTLITRIVQTVNKKLRCYYNFSINSFYELVEGCNTYEEFCKILLDMDAHKEYEFETLESYNDFLDYLLKNEDVKIYDEVIQNTKQINDNLYVRTNDLNSKH